jgi:hypothetical protein
MHAEMRDSLYTDNVICKESLHVLSKLVIFSQFTFLLSSFCLLKLAVVSRIVRIELEKVTTMPLFLVLMESSPLTMMLAMLFFIDAPY